MRGLVLLFSSLLAATAMANSWARFPDRSLDGWLADEAVPQLSQTLSEHPRFKGETVRIAVLDGSDVAAQPDGLSVATRNALHAALMQNQGLRIAMAEGPEDCASRSRDGYFVAIEAAAVSGRNGNVQIRIYDIVEQRWVSGFSYQWRGELSAAQRAAVRRTETAATARGLRIAPYTADQSDLLAAHLAGELACQLKRSGDDELAVQPVGGTAAALIAGNLAGSHQIPVAAAGQLQLTTRVHKVDNNLYQVWAILNTADNADPGSVTSSAYATRPLLRSTAGHARKPTVRADAPAPIAPRAVTLLSDLRVHAAAADSCATLTPQEAEDLGDQPETDPGDCYGLQFSARPGATVFVVRHQYDSRLVRMQPSSCTDSATMLRHDGPGGSESFYVLAAATARAAARLQRVLSHLPDACDDASGYRAQPGWLASLDEAVGDSGDDVAWRSVRVYHQPAAFAGQLSNGAKP
ncbi:MAG: hypothetical protein KJO54_00165 [Gammaproteobacteria bacterium]|nr:hypothetical protein [Gammaproteobacteria bacterium]